MEFGTRPEAAGTGLTPDPVPTLAQFHAAREVMVREQIAVRGIRDAGAQ